jgi:beta-lactamase regulating signal transducer with metallopeptidase domain
MSEALIDHLWQSTLFALAAALLTLAFRGSGARVRFLIWLAASVKFLIPFSLFVWIGRQLRWESAPVLPGGSGLSVLMDQIAQPATAIATGMPSTVSNSGWSVGTLLLFIWLAGAVLLIGRRVYQWLYVRAVAEASSPSDIDAPIPVRETRSTLEPGLFGILSPTLLLPAGIATQLEPAQLHAIVDHELCHWRRKDNLTAAIHMLVEALFWFHPMVWWLGARMVVERERACDEAVIQSGRDRHAYAEGILRICQRYVEPPLCSAGVSGGSLRTRIEEIMTNPVLGRLSVARKSLLSAMALIAIAAPIAVGMAGGAGDADAPEMRHYTNSEWKFELDVPKRWIVMPPVSGNSPFEVLRFMSRENGNHNLIVFRNPVDPKQSMDVVLEQVQQVLAKAGFSNFVTGETTIGSRKVPTLEYSRLAPDGVTTWYCRQYFMFEGPLGFVLGFGTTNRDEKFELYERMAKSFSFDAT